MGTHPLLLFNAQGFENFCETFIFLSVLPVSHLFPNSPRIRTKRHRLARNHASKVFKEGVSCTFSRPYL